MYDPVPNTHFVCRVWPTSQQHVDCGLLGISQIAQWQLGARHWHVLQCPALKERLY